MEISFVGVHSVMSQPQTLTMKKLWKFQKTNLLEPWYFFSLFLFNLAAEHAMRVYADISLFSFLFLKLCQRSLARSAYNRDDFKTAKSLWYADSLDKSNLLFAHFIYLLKW